MSNALSRAFLHFAWCGWLVPGLWFAFQMLVRRKWLKTEIWLPSTWRPQLLLATLIIGLVPCLREPIDVWMGWEPGWKSITDCLSWILPSLFAGWGTYRILIRGKQLPL
jgi:hypothetical protein